MLKIISAKLDERVIVTRRGLPVRALGPGRHFLWGFGLDERRWSTDTIVFDMPASGHSISMLRVPWVIVDTVPEGPLTRDARSVQHLLRDPARTAVVIVTLAEEMPANEARDLTAKFDQLMGLRPQSVVVNQIYPSRFPDGSPQGRVLDGLVGELGDPGLDDRLRALALHGDLARSRRRLNERYVQQLAATVPAPQTHLPLLFTAVGLGPREIDYLSRLVETSWSGGASGAGATGSTGSGP